MVFLLLAFSIVDQVCVYYTTLFVLLYLAVQNQHTKSDKEKNVFLLGFSFVI